MIFIARHRCICIMLIGMISCSPFRSDDSSHKQYLVPGKNPSGEIVPNWELNVLAGAGGIKSTAEDLAKYLRAQMTDITYFFLTQRPTIQYTEHNTAGLGWAWYTYPFPSKSDSTA